MKFRVPREDFADSVAWVARSLPSRPPVPVLGGVLLGADERGLTVSGFDYEVSAQVHVSAEVITPGQVLVSGKLLADITRALPHKPVDVVLDGTRVLITCGSAKFSLPTMPVEDYPQLPALPQQTGALSGDLFAEAISQVAVAAGKLFGYEGQRILVANGEEFCTTSPASFDSFRAGSTLDGTGLNPMCVRVNTFVADYLDNGQAEMFTSDIEYQYGDDLVTNTWRDAQLKVNHPLRVGSDRVYLQGHGYAPTFTVTWPNGETRTETMQWAPDDATTFLSSGAMRFDPPGGMYPDADERRKNQIAIEGLFAPTASFHGTLLTSIFPALTDPAVAIDIYKGDSGLDTGNPQSLFSLNKELINQGRLVKQDRVNLRPGESVTLADGTEVRFDKATDFVNLQVSHDPAQQWVLVAAIFMMGGLLVSLLVKRRRVWARAYPDGTVSDGERRTVVELGGLARTDQAGWGDEFDRLVERLLGDDAPSAPAAQEKKN